MIRMIWITLCLCLVAPSYGEGDNEYFKKGILAYEQGDYQTAFQVFSSLAKQGYIAPLIRLGDMCFYGKGFERDYALAAQFYRTAAEQGDGFAQYDLAKMYAKGLGVEQNYMEALKWYGKSAEQGNVKAMFRMAFIYCEFEEKGLHQNQENPILAHMWFCLASAHDEEDIVLMKDGESIVVFHASFLNNKQIAEAQRRALEWMEKRSKN